MFNSIRGRIVVILVMVGVSIGYLWNSGIKLGLDLQGGMHLALEVDDPESLMTPEATADAIDRIERILRTRIDEFGVEEPLVQKAGLYRLIVELPGIGLGDESRAKNLIQQAAFLEFKLVLSVTEFEPALARIDRQIVGVLGVDSIRALGRDTEAPNQDIQNLIFGGETADSSLADSTGVDGEAEEEDQSNNLRPFTSLLSSGDIEGAYLVATEDVEVATFFLALPEVQRAMPRNVSVHWEADLIGFGQRTYRRLMVTEEDAFVTGDMLEDATAQRDPQFNQAQVNFEFNRAGGRRFSNFTTQHIGDFIAIVLDDEIVSAPVVARPHRSQRRHQHGQCRHDRSRRPRVGTASGRVAGPSGDRGGADGRTLPWAGFRRSGSDRRPHWIGRCGPDHDSLLPRGGGFGRDGSGCVRHVGHGWPWRRSTPC